MNRWHVMTLKLSLPSIYVAVISILAAAVIYNIKDVAFLSQIYLMLRWLPYVGFGLSFILLVAAGFRIWLWQNGHIDDCPACGGMLGFERNGRYGPFKGCLACSKNVSQKHYQ